MVSNKVNRNNSRSNNSSKLNSQASAAKPPDRLDTKAALAALATTDGYRVLKVVAEVLAHNYAGPGLPTTEAAETRFFNAAVMRRGFELLWSEVERQAQQQTKEPSFVQQMMNATIDQPREASTETERL